MPFRDPLAGSGSGRGVVAVHPQDTKLRSIPILENAAEVPKRGARKGEGKKAKMSATDQAWGGGSLNPIPKIQRLTMLKRLNSNQPNYGGKKKMLRQPLGTLESFKRSFRGC